MEFHDYYKSNIDKKLIEVDRLRKKLLLNYSIISFVVTIGFVAEAITWMLLAITGLVIFIFWYTYHYSFSFNTFHLQHEDVIYENVLKFLFPNLEYDRNRYIKLNDLKDSFLISGNPQQYTGSHLISWNEKNEFGMISYINSKSILSKENNDQNIFEYFNGIVCIVKLPAFQKSTTLFLHHSIQYNNGKNNLIKQNIKLNKSEMFVYSNSKEETSQLIERIANAIEEDKSIDKSEIFISLQQDKITIALSKPAHFNYIKSNVTKSVVSTKASELLFRDVQFFKTILNTVRIS